MPSVVKGGAYSSRGIEVLLISFQWTNSPVDNKSIAGILFETADLLEVDGGDSFRIRSYRNAAEAIEAFPQQISDLIANEKDVLAIPGIGKGMLANLREMLGEGKLSLHAELLKKYHPSMLQLLKDQ